MRGIASFIAGFGNGYFKAEDKKYERERQDRLDKQANELHTARMTEILATQDERQRERDFREANVAALSAGKTDVGQVVTDAAGSNAYTKDADAAAVLQDMAQTANGGAQVAPATRVLTGMQGATQRGTIPGQQVFTDPAKAQEFAQSMPMTEFAKLKARKDVAEQYGKLEIADDMRGKLENLASKGVFKAGSLLDAGNADGALKVLQDMNPDLVPKGAQFKQVDVPDMFDHSKTTKGWALVAPGAEGQPERVLVGDFRDAVFGYLTPQEQFSNRRALRTDARDERKTPVSERQADIAERRLGALEARAYGGGSGGAGSSGAGAAGWKERREVLGDFGKLLPSADTAATPQEAKDIQAGNARTLARADAMFSANAAFGTLLSAPQITQAMELARDPKNLRTIRDSQTGQMYETVSVNGRPVVVGEVVQQPPQTQAAQGRAAAGGKQSHMTDATGNAKPKGPGALTDANGDIQLMQPLFNLDAYRRRLQEQVNQAQ